MASFDNETGNLSKFFKEDFEFFFKFSGIDLNLKESYVAIADCRGSWNGIWSLQSSW
jgi:hypothetical protein